MHQLREPRWISSENVVTDDMTEIGLRLEMSPTKVKKQSHPKTRIGARQRHMPGIGGPDDCRTGRSDNRDHVVTYLPHFA